MPSRFSIASSFWYLQVHDVINIELTSVCIRELKDHRRTIQKTSTGLYKSLSYTYSFASFFFDIVPSLVFKSTPLKS